MVGTGGWDCAVSFASAMAVVMCALHFVHRNDSIQKLSVDFSGTDKVGLTATFLSEDPLPAGKGSTERSPAWSNKTNYIQFEAAFSVTNGPSYNKASPVGLDLGVKQHAIINYWKLSMQYSFHCKEDSFPSHTHTFKGLFIYLACHNSFKSLVCPLLH